MVPNGAAGRTIAGPSTSDTTICAVRPPGSTVILRAQIDAAGERVTAPTGLTDPEPLRDVPTIDMIAPLSAPSIAPAAICATSGANIHSVRLMPGVMNPGSSAALATDTAKMRARLPASPDGATAR